MTENITSQAEQTLLESIIKNFLKTKEKIDIIQVEEIGGWLVRFKDQGRRGRGYEPDEAVTELTKLGLRPAQPNELEHRVMQKFGCKHSIVALGQKEVGHGFSETSGGYSTEEYYTLSPSKDGQKCFYDWVSCHTPSDQYYCLAFSFE